MLEEEEIYQTKNNTYPDFSNLRDFEKGDCIYDESTESFEDEDDDTDCDNDSMTKRTTVVVIMIYMTKTTRKPFQKDLLTCRLSKDSEKKQLQSLKQPKSFLRTRGSSARVSMRVLFTVFLNTAQTKMREMKQKSFLRRKKKRATTTITMAKILPL